jgi:hypothetical protein
MSIKFDINVIGLGKLLRTLIKVSKKVEKAAGNALYQEGVAIMSKSLRQVPIEYGDLRDSHYVIPPKMGGMGIPAVSLGYGTKYGVFVHEGHYRHIVGKRKYLEDPIKQAQAGYLKRIATRTWNNYRRGNFTIQIKMPTTPKFGPHYEGRKPRKRRKR